MLHTLVGKFGMLELIEHLPAAGYFLILLMLVVFYSVEFRQWWKAERLRRDFEEFEAAILDRSIPLNKCRFLNGETQIPSEMTVHIPLYPGHSWYELDALTQGIQEGLVARSIGEVIRKFKFEGGAGVDLSLTDFVSGVEFLRVFLLDANVPYGTLLEYEFGELPIYD